MLRLAQSESSVAVAGTGDNYGTSFNLDYLEAAAVEFKATSGGETVNVDIYVEQSSTKLSASEEGSVHDEYVQPENTTKLLTLANENWHSIVINPIALKYARFYFDGQTGNYSGTVIQWRLSKQERSGR